MFFPKCLNSKAQEALSNNGFILPCCWVDNLEAKEDPRIDALFSEHLHINNIKSREELLFSKEWLELFQDLLDENDIPKTCLRECSNKQRAYRRDSYFGNDAKIIVKA